MVWNPLTVLTSAAKVLSQSLESINRSNLCNTSSVSGFGIHLPVKPLQQTLCHRVWNPFTSLTATTNVMSQGLEFINRSNLCNNVLSQRLECINRSNLNNKRSVTGFGIH